MSDFALGRFPTPKGRYMTNIQRGGIAVRVDAKLILLQFQCSLRGGLQVGEGRWDMWPSLALCISINLGGTNRDLIVE